jgi:hypothetical protein
MNAAKKICFAGRPGPVFGGGEFRNGPGAVDLRDKFAPPVVDRKASALLPVREDQRSSPAFGIGFLHQPAAIVTVAKIPGRLHSGQRVRDRRVGISGCAQIRDSAGCLFQNSSRPIHDLACHLVIEKPPQIDCLQLQRRLAARLRREQVRILDCPRIEDEQNMRLRHAFKREIHSALALGINRI